MELNMLWKFEKVITRIVKYGIFYDGYGSLNCLEYVVLKKVSRTKAITMRAHDCLEAIRMAGGTSLENLQY